MLAAFLNVPANVGYPLLGLLVGAEAAGAFVPGETSLIVAATLAAQGRLTLTIVIAVAAGAAIIGDNIGYQLGRRGLRRLFDRRARSARLFARGEAFFQRHGRAAVFFGRWVPGLRVLASWLAGANRMPWRRFLLWNALGGISWAATVGTAAYLLGRSASGSLFVVEGAAIAIGAAVYVIRRAREKRATPTLSAEPGSTRRR